jgi:hypothetical protein
VSLFSFPLLDLSVFKAKLNSINNTWQCKWALNFTVLEQYTLNSTGACVNEALEMPVGSTILGLGSDTQCKNCFSDDRLKLEDGKDYVVAGVVKRYDGCNGVYWELAGTHSLIVPFPTKKGKIEGYVKRGNNHRCQ